jgi:hypothetical protein
VYFNPVLGAGSADTTNTAPIYNPLTTPNTPVYRLGGGGGQGYLQLGGGAYENVLTGTANVQIGAIVTPNAAAGLGYVNGNIGSVNLVNRNDLSANSTVFINKDSNLQLANAFGLGAATVVLNGGAMQLNAPITNPGQHDF